MTALCIGSTGVQRAPQPFCSNGLTSLLQGIEAIAMKRKTQDRQFQGATLTKDAILTYFEDKAKQWIRAYPPLQSVSPNDLQANVFLCKTSWYPVGARVAPKTRNALSSLPSLPPNVRYHWESEPAPARVNLQKPFVDWILHASKPGIELKKLVTDDGELKQIRAKVASYANNVLSKESRDPYIATAENAILLTLLGQMVTAANAPQCPLPPGWLALSTFRSPTTEESIETAIQGAKSTNDTECTYTSGLFQMKAVGPTYDAWACAYVLLWESIGPLAPKGDELKNGKLSEALPDKTEFTLEEWVAFQIDTPLRTSHFIRANDARYFKPKYAVWQVASGLKWRELEDRPGDGKELHNPQLAETLMSMRCTDQAGTLTQDEWDSFSVTTPVFYTDFVAGEGVYFVPVCAQVTPMHAKSNINAWCLFLALTTTNDKVDRLKQEPISEDAITFMQQKDIPEDEQDKDVIKLAEVSQRVAAAKDVKKTATSAKRKGKAPAAGAAGCSGSNEMPAQAAEQGTADALMDPDPATQPIEEAGHSLFPMHDLTRYARGEDGDTPPRTPERDPSSPAYRLGADEVANLQASSPADQSGATNVYGSARSALPPLPVRDVNILEDARRPEA